MYYILDSDNNPVPEPDAIKFGRWFRQCDRTVLRTVIGRSDGSNQDITATVSTVFLGLNRNFAQKGPPVLWETMVFGGPLNKEIERYTSYAAAVIGHEAMVKRCR